jgi:hypothetical protein
MNSRKHDIASIYLILTIKTFSNEFCAAETNLELFFLFFDLT